MIFFIPGRPAWDRTASAFDGADQSHREQMWVITRVALFLKCNFRRPEQGSLLIPCTLALVNRLREFTVTDARKSHCPLRRSWRTVSVQDAPSPSLLRASSPRQDRRRRAAGSTAALISESPTPSPTAPALAPDGGPSPPLPSHCSVPDHDLQNHWSQ